MRTCPGDQQHAKIWGDWENGSEVVRDIAQLGYGMGETMRVDCGVSGHNRQVNCEVRERLSDMSIRKATWQKKVVRLELQD